jgi:uncharacterized protein YlzI (FlbEa/FlbD family)
MNGLSIETKKEDPHIRTTLLNGEEYISSFKVDPSEVSTPIVVSE